MRIIFISLLSVVILFVSQHTFAQEFVEANVVLPEFPDKKEVFNRLQFDLELSWDQEFEDYSTEYVNNTLSVSTINYDEHTSVSFVEFNRSNWADADGMESVMSVYAQELLNMGYTRVKLDPVKRTCKYWHLRTIRSEFKKDDEVYTVEVSGLADGDASVVVASISNSKYSDDTKAAEFLRNVWDGFILTPGAWREKRSYLFDTDHKIEGELFSLGYKGEHETESMYLDTNLQQYSLSYDEDTYFLVYESIGVDGLRPVFDVLTEEFIDEGYTMEVDEETWVLKSGQEIDMLDAYLKLSTNGGYTRKRMRVQVAAAGNEESGFVVVSFCPEAPYKNNERTRFVRTVWENIEYK